MEENCTTCEHFKAIYYNGKQINSTCTELHICYHYNKAFKNKYKPRLKVFKNNLSK